jgi:hypothetical protein
MSLAFRALSGTPAFALGPVRPQFSAVVLGQCFAIAPSIGSEEGRLSIANLLDLADEDLSILSTVFADMRSETQLGVRLQGSPDQGFSDGVKVWLVTPDVLLLV